jgi:hypothetical protein
MKSSLLFLTLTGLLCSPLVIARNFTGISPEPATSSTQQLSPDEIIRRFTQKESELREVWKEYIYRQETRLQVLGPANTISGEFYQLSEFVFNDAGRRIERILRAPQSSLDQAGLIMTAEDKNALTNLQPFALTAEELPGYNLRYIGKEKIDELNTYVFEVTPKILSNPRELDRARKDKIEGNYFQGRVWVDDQDFQIVKTAGKTVPEFKQRFPKFETYRENIDGRYWFPTYTYGDDELVFEKGFAVHVRLVVRYKDYRRFQADIRIVGEAEEVQPDKNKESGKPAKPNEKEPEKKIKPPLP